MVLMHQGESKRCFGFSKKVPKKIRGKFIYTMGSGTEFIDILNLGAFSKPLCLIRREPMFYCWNSWLHRNLSWLLLFKPSILVWLFYFSTYTMNSPKSIQESHEMVIRDYKIWGGKFLKNIGTFPAKQVLLHHIKFIGTSERTTHHHLLEKPLIKVCRHHQPNTK